MQLVRPERVVRESVRGGDGGGAGAGPNAHHRPLLINERLNAKRKVRRAVRERHRHREAVGHLNRLGLAEHRRALDDDGVGGDGEGGAAVAGHPAEPRPPPAEDRAVALEGHEANAKVG